jgi:membrane-associated PAP2 superfamily phosphatase
VSCRLALARRWRGPLGTMALSVLLGVGAVGAMKQVTNVDCPWSLTEFGGERPYVSLFADRPDNLQRGRCFPGAHSSSGFALFACYFAALGRGRWRARLALGVALLVGGGFAAGQEARGAHFLSHDLWSAAIMWFSCLAVHVFRYKWSREGPRLIRPPIPVQASDSNRSIGRALAG